MNVFKSIVTNARRHLVTLGVVAVVIVGLVLAIIWWPKSSGEAATGSEVWTCSMHPQVRLPRPGPCPICGMKLIPTSKLTAKKGGGNRHSSLETQAVVRRELFQEIQTVGKIVGPLRATRRCRTGSFSGRDLSRNRDLHRSLSR